MHLTGFVGREAELSALSQSLKSTRLLTLTGAGGSGKTRLAREAAARETSQLGTSQLGTSQLGTSERGTARHGATQPPPQVVWVDLAPISESVLVAPHIAATLGIPEHAQLTMEQRLVAGIGERELLLVLDNCEHVVEACAQITFALLRGCRRLRILATSREALGVLGETAWLVPRLDEHEAIALFAERATAVQPTFTLAEGNREAVRQICQRLDGIPLAIELAAARVRVLSPAQIQARLDDVFSLLTVNSRTALPRHRTLRSTMDWSFGLLSGREQSLLRRLSAFAGSFSLEAAESVCADDRESAQHEAWLEPHDVLDGVAALVDKSLVAMEVDEFAARYRLLETVRQYALEYLNSSGELELLRARHARYYLAFAESVAPRLVGGEHEVGLLARVTREHDNLRAASQWAMERPERAEDALRFADALFWYWYGSGYWLRTGQFNEARTYLDRAIEAGRSAPAALLGRALLARGLNALAQGDWEVALGAFQESLALIRPAGDRAALAVVLSKLGAAHLMRGESATAQRLLEEAHAVSQELTPAMVHAFVLFWFGWLRLTQGALPQVFELHEEALRVGRALAHHRTIRAHQASLIARAYLMRGELVMAAQALREAWTLHRAIGDGWGLSVDLEGVIRLLAARGDLSEATRVIGVTDALRHRIGVAMLTTDIKEHAAIAGAARGLLGTSYVSLHTAGAELDNDAVGALVNSITAVPDLEATHGVSTRGGLGAPLNDVPDDARAKPFAPLEVRALGPLQVLVNNVAVESGAWGSSRPRELLVYLLLHPDGATKEQVGLALWPDASTAQLRNSFHVTMYRLRKALGESADDWVVLANDRYTVNPARLAGFDVARFEHEAARARLALDERADGADQQMERVLTLYRGDFLDGEPVGDWPRAHRARLQRTYVESLTALGRAHEQAQRDERAVDAYARALTREPLDEHVTGALMRAYARRGEHAQALRVFQRFAERLRHDLRVEPAEQTSALAERIRAGGTE